MNPAAPEVMTASGGVDAEQTSCEITLFTSSRDGIVALVDGDKWRVAEAALGVAGFERAEDGVRAISLQDPGRIREALLILGMSAQVARIKITPSGDTYLGDFARDLVAHLPGQWNVKVENFAMPIWQGDLAECMWSTGPVAAVLDEHRVAWAAVLEREDGAELAIIRDPQHDVYHVGALQPRGLRPDRLVPPPAGVSVPPTPTTAAQQIASRLLPAYTRAVMHWQVNSLADALLRAESASPMGTAPSPVLLADAFTLLTTTARHITSAVSALATLTEHENAFLDRVDKAIAEPTPAAITPGVPSADRLAWWLTEGGQGLISLARRAVRDSEPTAAEAARVLSSRPGLPPGPASSTQAPRR